MSANKHPQPRPPLSLSLRFSDEASSLPLALELWVQNISIREHQISLSSPKRYREGMELSLTPASGADEATFVQAQKHFRPQSDDVFDIAVGESVSVHADQFKVVQPGEQHAYFMMWGVSQIFGHVVPGTYSATASLTIREGTWTGTLHAAPVLVTLP